MTAAEHALAERRPCAPAREISADRAVVSDDGHEMRLVAYRGAETMAAVELQPLRAVALAHELLDAALRRLRRESASAPRRRRGGDPHAIGRRQRDDALRQLAALAGAAPVERLARELVERIGRYRPAPVESSEERRLMRQVVESGLRLPGPDRTARIIRRGIGR